MPFVEDKPQLAPVDSLARIGINVPVVTPALFCALGPVEVAGLWYTAPVAMRSWRAVKPPVARGWKLFAPAHKGGGF
jgi:hypothetical protein